MSLATNVENSKSSRMSKKRKSLQEKFSDPQYIIDEISNYVREGDIAACTDLLSAYIANSPKYKNQEQFAEAIGTTRQTLHRMFAHENVSLNIFFKAVERIFKDANR